MNCPACQRGNIVTLAHEWSIEVVLNHLAEDFSAANEVLDRTGDCAYCLRSIVGYLAALVGSQSVFIAEEAGHTAAAAIWRWEQILAGE